ncbi:thioesterase II family protein [Actinomadura sp. WMMB 499]|uniref:thioesterase II family protein n=1 Tax=Actinomadura sp. WMMB 499 TaxID=1219491 RepID=UPI001247500F|nr:alpha/beta fold hydrolase [Actinomadura sp. WMMB 499]QFG20263.1 thioesterase [Actinomadura sp. WMMB 499]
MSMSAAMDERWFRRFAESGPAAQGPPRRLICFPHAGGSASFYFPFARELAGVCELLAVQYPGRQDRRAEPACTDLEVLADRVHAALPRDSGTPTALFGHSMGAVLAYEVARRLERDGAGPAALIVSGRRAPAARRHEDVHRRGDDLLLAEVAGLSGTAPALLEDEELRRLILPPLRADYRAVETYRHRSGPPLGCPISVLTGDRDPRVSPAEAEAWRGHTDADFRLRTFPGGHFYLNERRAEVAAAIAADLRRHAAGR